MLQPWIDSTSAKRSVAELSEAAGMNLVAISANASDEELKKTEVAQPLLLAAALLSWQAFQESSDQARNFPVSGVAGHSVGEFAAAVIAGVLAPSDAMSLVTTRGDAMAQASEEPTTGMVAVLGGDELEVINAIERSGVFVANKNATGQIVAAGLVAKLDELSANLPAGCRARPLAVAGAFHTKYMQSAVDKFAEAAEKIEFRDPQITVISNNSGLELKTGQQVREHLTKQIARQVDWVSCQHAFVELGVTQMIELAPGKTLSSIAKRQVPGIAAHPIASLMPT
jgi:[acyl-carrier-protein] S-malonyltransferase